MSISEAYRNHDGLGLAALLRAGEVTPFELMEVAVENIEARNPALNAVVDRIYDRAGQALAEGLPEGPFTAVPFLLKDLYCFYGGTPCGNGSRLFDGFVPQEDSELVRRYKNAGLLILGKTTTSELGFSVSTETAACGTTRNPWDLTRSSGGSSGGSGAAVAAGMVPMAHGSDGGGSIRIPASVCGLFGLKPTRARIPTFEGWAGLAVQHALTRSVRDSAALLDATQGYAVGNPYSAPAPSRPFLAEVGADPGRLKIALNYKTRADVPLHPDCRAAVLEAAALAAELGHEVEEASPGIEAEGLEKAMMTIVTANTAADLAAGHPTQARPVAEADVEAAIWHAAEEGRDLSALDYIRAVEKVQEVGRVLGGFLAQYDAVLSPTLAQPPALLGTVDSQGDYKAFREAVLPYVTFTQMFNMSGQPAASLPLYWNTEGLPIGVQFAAGFGREDLLIRLASQFEQARPWFGRLAPAEGLS